MLNIKASFGPRGGARGCDLYHTPNYPKVEREGKSEQNYSREIPREWHIQSAGLLFTSVTLDLIFRTTTILPPGFSLLFLFVVWFLCVWFTGEL